MPLALAKPRNEQLLGAQLDLVLCQVRHERNVAVSDANRALAVHDRINEYYPQVAEFTAQEITVASGPAGSAITTPSESRGWKFQDASDEWRVVLMPDFLTLETSAYTNWSQFRSRMEVLLLAVHEELRPRLEQRLGLRYIDRLTWPVVDEPSGWKRWIEPSLLGPILHQAFGPAVRQCEQLLDLDGGNGMVVRLRHGLQPSPDTDSWAYVLDHDCSVTTGSRFDPDSLMTGADALHTLILQVFQAAITEDLYELLLKGSSE